MAISPRLDLRQSQSLVMTMQMQQSIKLLALSNVEVEAFIADALEGNPLLDVAAKPEPVPERAPRSTEPSRDDAPLQRYDFDFTAIVADAPSLHDHLVAQAGASLRGVAYHHACAVIDHIDAAGYLATPLTNIAGSLGISEGQAEAVLTHIQSFDPTGVGARSLAECLSLQAQEADRYDPAMAQLIAQLDLLAQGKRAYVQRLCGVDDDDFRDMLAELRNYDPKPGLRFDTQQANSIIPDVLVTHAAEGWRVEINTARLPRLLVNEHYYAETSASAQSKQSKLWLKEARAHAHWLVKALDQRQRTIISVATEIVRVQHSFFTHGAAQLKPLTLKQVAEAVGLHESTVSRVTNGKYLSAARGTFELKYFFSTAVGGKGGGDGEAEGASATAIRNALKALIAEEDAAILSDDQLVSLLRAQGFALARRTVTKYREALGLGSSVQRRRARAMAGK